MTAHNGEEVIWRWNNIHQHSLMFFSPADGSAEPYPSHAGQWREQQPATAWLYNPWTGAQRKAEDVGSDLFGNLILPPGEVLR